MSHVDEGRLHAWLDRSLSEEERAEVHAHLAECADCRAQLEKAQRYRVRAEQLLGLAAPGAVEAPPFEAIRARKTTTPVAASAAAPPEMAEPPAPAQTAEPTEPAPPAIVAFPAEATPRRRIPWGLAWAAVLVLALGLGWLARTLLTRESDQQRVATAERVAPAAGRAARESAPPPAVVPTPLAAAPAATPPSAGAAQPAGAGVAANAARPTHPTPGAAASRSAFAAPSKRPTARRPAAPSPASAAAPTHPATDTTALPLAAREPVNTPHQDSLAGARAAEARKVAADVAAPQPAPAAAKQAEARPAAPPAVALEQLVVADSAVAPQNELVRRRAVAEMALGTRIRFVSGLPVLDILLARDDGGQLSAAAIQRLPSGDTLQLVQRVAMPSAAPPLVPPGTGPLPAAPAGASTVSITREGVSLTLRAPVPPDSLASLLQRVR